jgi:hypothetical protein
MSTSSVVVSKYFWSRVPGSLICLTEEKRMGFDAVVVGAIASVVISILVVGVIAYRVLKQIGDDKAQD